MAYAGQQHLHKDLKLAQSFRCGSEHDWLSYLV